MNVVALHGSLRGASCNGGLLHFAMAAAPAAPDLNISHLDISQWPLFSGFNPSQGGAKRRAGEHQKVYDCDAVVVVTPEYNWACSQ